MATVKLIYAVALVALYCAGVVATNEVDVPAECKDKVICDVKPDSYDELKNDMEEKFKLIKEMFNLIEEKEEEDDYEDDYPEYFHPPNSCSYKTQTVTPYVVQTNGTTKVIVQTDFYKQKFKTTECWSSQSSPEGETCFEKFSSISSGHCKNKYTTIILYAYNMAKQKIERVAVEVPVCCHCAMSYSNDLM